MYLWYNIVMKSKDSVVPEQKFFVGDLVMITEDYWPYLKKGQTGLITLARCDYVCSKGGVIGLSEPEGGPRYTLEWCYVGRFNMDRMPQGVRLSRLSPAEVISEIR